MKPELQNRIRLFFYGMSLLVSTLFSCNAGAQKGIKDLAGNVYVLHTSQADPDQVQAIRIDAVKGDTILVKYKIGSEAFLDADFVWSAASRQYRSLQPLTYGAHAQYKSAASLTAGDTSLHLQWQGQSAQIPFRKRYNKPVDLKTHRDPYYAEDGFTLDP